MSKKKVIISLMVISTIVYVFVFILMGMNYLDIEKNYHQAEQAYITEVEEKLAIALRVENGLEEELQKLVSEYPLELVVKEEEKEIFSTISLDTKSNMHGVLNTEAVAIESAGIVETSKELYVWYSIYHMPTPGYIEVFLGQQNILFFIAFFVLLILIFVLQYYLLGPLYRVKHSIEKLENYEFDKVQEGKDILDKKMNAFSNKLNTTIRAVSRKNTNLELSLQREKERLHNTIQFSRALIHDLKSPVHQTLLENESIIEKQENEDVIALGTYNIQRTDALLKDINDILKVMGQDIYQLNQVFEVFDVVQLVQDTIKLFKTTLWNKNMSFQLDAEEILEISSNKIALRLLLHNVISNMMQYGSPKSELLVALQIENNNLEVISRNISSKENIERMQKSEQLFNVVIEEASKEHVYSSGNGLFLIKDLTLLLEGEYICRVEGEEVIVELKIPLGEKQNEDS